ncbi:uncharacterized protein RJT21DRAFT_121359 [Scheffersomyces amazonensis]|uniref:uncharacterized protein n=1 Tax=Scheffersomyces amazonensis TaxID=1078765 RepID=UPI00315CDCB3
MAEPSRNNSKQSQKDLNLNDRPKQDDSIEKNRYGTGATTLNSNNNFNSIDTRITVPTNPFETSNIRTYNHSANTIPPYVLDTLSKVHYREQLNNTNVNNNQSDINPSIKSIHSKATDDDQYLSFANDPYVKSLDNNWSTFISSIANPASYTTGQIKLDKFVSEKEWDLNTHWGGDDRLKSALLGPVSSEETYSNDLENSTSFFRFFKFRRHKRHHNDEDHLPYDPENPKVRSRAGYWMSNEKRKDLFPTIKRIFVQNPLVPLILRIFIIIISLISLAIACSIFVYSKRQYNGESVEEQPSTIMSIVVDTCAIVYVVYIAYDEYNGRPLGLRDPLGKMRLIMLDLLFIIFSSANLSLTFNTLYDKEYVCIEDDNPDLAKIGLVFPVVSSICGRQRALAALLFTVLCLWVITFTVSIIRVVDRVSLSANPNND